MNADSHRSHRGFSVLLPVYVNDVPGHVDVALRSVLEQTVPPTEVIIVADGALSGPLERTVSAWGDRHSETITVVRTPEDSGLPEALNVGLERCNTDLVARMDADDIAHERRFERQLEFMAQHPQADVVGGYVGEFVENPDRVSNVRTVPTTPASVERFARFRCPVNHPTVMLEKSQVLSVGGYRPGIGIEDYDLWVRMLNRGHTIMNIPEVLVYARAGDELYERRGGLGYLLTEYRLQREFLDRGFISLDRFLANLCVRVPVRLMPNGLRRYVYRRFFR